MIHTTFVLLLPKYRVHKWLYFNVYTQCVKVNDIFILCLREWLFYTHAGFYLLKINLHASSQLNFYVFFFPIFLNLSQYEGKNEFN